MRRAQGIQREADYLFDCSYFEYFYRIMQHNRYVKDYNESLKKPTET